MQPLLPAGTLNFSEASSHLTARSTKVERMVNAKLLEECGYTIRALQINLRAEEPLDQNRVRDIDCVYAIAHVRQQIFRKLQKREKGLVNDEALQDTFNLLGVLMRHYALMHNRRYADEIRLVA